MKPMQLAEWVAQRSQRQRARPSQHTSGHSERRTHLLATPSSVNTSKCFQHLLGAQQTHETNSLMALVELDKNALTSKSRRKANFYNKLLSLIFLHAILSHLNYVSFKQAYKSDLADKRQETAPGLPNILLASAIECSLDSDCNNREKICHENKCICTRDRPIEDQDRCLSLSLIGELCTLNEQCLGNSFCSDGICACGLDAISLFNPSAKIYYCHPKRRLNEKCTNDQQCPENAYCSTEKNGCLCQNGFGPGVVNNAGSESLECLPKTCQDSKDCIESDFHTCEENRCVCLATHFDPTSAKCYMFGSTGGKPVDESTKGAENSTTGAADDSPNNNIYSIFKDLRDNGDMMWLVLIILISLSILMLVLILMLIRKYYLGYCWTAHKQEYEPNNKNLPKNSFFSKDSINNKSFRKKNGDIDEGDNDSLTADLSNLVAASGKADEKHPSRSSPTTKTPYTSSANQRYDYVEVDMNGGQLLNNSASTDDSDGPMFRQLIAPLKTSTSTPV